jgi:hypothetical protein
MRCDHPLDTPLPSCDTRTVNFPVKLQQSGQRVQRDDITNQQNRAKRYYADGIMQNPCGYSGQIIYAMQSGSNCYQFDTDR